MAKKVFMGVRLRRLREERDMTQQELAAALKLSASYLNQLENNQRPLTLAVQLKLNSAFGTQLPLLSQDDEIRMIGNLRDVLADPALDESITTAELREIAYNMPAVGRAILTMHRRYHRTLEQSANFAARLGDDRQIEGRALPSTPFEEVRDFFYAYNNHFATLDETAEAIAQEENFSIGQMVEGLSARLHHRHGIRVVIGGSEGAGGGLQRNLDTEAGVLRLSHRLGEGQQAFQIATQLAFLEQHEAIDAIVARATFTDPQSPDLARVGLANYFAGALILPYTTFRLAAEEVRYDIELLGQRFGVGFETICHRLSTLQRRGARGIPFFFIRVDRAGNISKRQSATDFHFSRIGGTCPLWNVYEAFTQPGRVLTQLAQMPDERTYLWIARTVSRGSGGYHAPRKTFAIALGCDIRHAERLVYADGIDLRNPAAVTLIGAGCKICDRPACPQRAFPPVGRPITIDENRSRFSPYAAKE